MSYQLSADFELLVGDLLADPGTLVGLINTFNRSKQRNNDSFPVFGQATPITIPGAPETSYTANGYLDPADAGQDILRAAEQGNTTVFIQALFDGTNGFKQEVRVSSTTFDAAAEGGLQEVSWEFVAVGDPTAVGTGPIL